MIGDDGWILIVILKMFVYLVLINIIFDICVLFVSKNYNDYNNCD